MSSTLMALVQGALLRQQQTKQADPLMSKNIFASQSPPGLERSISAVTTLAQPVAVTDTHSFAVQIPVLLKDLLDVVSEIARTDGLLKEAQKSVPQGAEAQKWHEVSCRALRWSRDALTARHTKTVARINELVQGGSSLTLAAPVKPVPTSVSKPLWLNVDAPEFCPTLKKSAVAQELEHHTSPQPGLAGAEHVGSLKEDLEKLRCYDRECCILVRKIKRLGVGSPDKIRAHFSFYGELAEVLVSHSFEKPNPKRANGRVRSAALGFIVFQNPDAAKALLVAGEHHVVGDGADAVTVSVEQYEPKHAEVGLEC